MDSKNDPPPYPVGMAQPMPMAYPAGPQYGVGQQSQYPYPGSQMNAGGQAPPIGFFVPATSTSSTPIIQQQVPTAQVDDEPKFTGGYHDDISGFDFSDKAIRRGFIRKVYSILSLQLGVTVGFIALFVSHDGVKKWTQENPGFLFAAIGVYFVTVICLACCEGIRRKAPTNYIFLSIFTLATSWMVATISSFYNEYTVLLAAGITLVIVIGLTIFAFQTKWDFTKFSGILFTVLFVFVIFGFMMIFLRGHFPILRMVYAALGALLFSAYLVYDTQLMIGGEHKYSISPEEYIFASLNLYLDVINIFLYILQLLGRNN